MPQPGWGRLIAQVVLATALLTLGLALAAQQLDWLALRAQPWLRIGQMLTVLAAAALLYFGCLWLTGLRLKAFLKR